MTDTTPHYERTAGQSKWIPELEGLRAFAALFVVISHYTVSKQSGGLFLELQRAFSQSAAANVSVTLFFSLSGFLLTYLAVNDVRQHGRLRIGNFYIRRILRIWPLYFLIVLVGYGLYAPWRFSPFEQDNVAGFWDWLQQNLWLFMLFISNWAQAFNGWITHFNIPSELGILWSIAVEEQFYVFFPLIFLIFYKIKKHKFQVLTLSVVLLIGLASRGAFIDNMPRGVSANGGMYYATTSYIEILFFGAVAGWCCAVGRHEQQDWVSKALRSLAHPMVGFLALVGLGLLAVTWKFYLWPPYSILSPFFYPLAGLVSSVLMYWIYQWRGSAYTTVLRALPITILGRISYGMYMWHLIVLSLSMEYRAYLSEQGDDFNVREVSFFFVYLAATIGLSTLSYLLLEKPILNFKQRFMHGVSSGPGRFQKDRSWLTLVAGCLLIFVIGNAVIQGDSVRIVAPPTKSISNLVYEINDFNSVTMSWKNGPREGVSYREYSLKGKGGKLLGRTRLSNSIEHAGISNISLSKGLEFAISTCNKYGCSSPSSIALPPVDITPRKLTVNRFDGQTGIRLSWAAPPILSPVMIEMNRGDGFEVIGNAPPKRTNYAVNDVNPLVAYQFRIRFCLQGNCSAYSAITTSSPDVTLMPRPTLQISRSDQNTIELIWSPINYGEAVMEMYRNDRFEIIGRTSGGFGIHGISNTSDDDPKVFRIRYCVRNTCTRYSNEVFDLPAGFTLEKPEMNAVRSKDNTAIELRWQTPALFSNMELEMMRGDNKFKLIGTAVIGRTNYMINGITPSSNYRFRVRSCLGDLCSPYSDEMLSRPTEKTN